MRNNQERTLTFAKSEILDALKKSREEHVAIVIEAQKGFREKLVEKLERKLAQAKAGEEVRLPINLSLPANHINDFDTAIRMFEMCTEDVLVLTEQEFKVYVCGEWGWGHHFLAANSGYSELASMRLSAQKIDPSTFGMEDQKVEAYK